MLDHKSRPDWITLLVVLFATWGATGIAANVFHFAAWPRSTAGASVFDTWHLWFMIGGNIGYDAILLAFALVIYRRPKATRLIVGLQTAVVVVVVLVQSNFNAWRQYKTNGIPPWKSVVTNELFLALVGVLTSAIPLLAVLVFLSTGSRRAFFENTGNAYCEGCGYDLTGNESGVCPECGRRVREVP